MMRQHDCYANHDHATQFDASCCDHQEIERLQLECELMYGASQRAVAEWCEQDPKGRALVLPDLKEHIVWAFTELASARADLGRVVEALKRHGRHDHLCAAWVAPHGACWRSSDANICNCGLAAVISPHPTPTTPGAAGEEVAKLREAAQAGLDLSTWAATIKWDHRERNTEAWLAGLKARIERVQGLAAPSPPRGDAGAAGGGERGGAGVNDPLACKQCHNTSEDGVDVCELCHLCEDCHDHSMVVPATREGRK